MSLHALNPNQFALPGMEKLAHPWAPMVAKGLTLHYEDVPQAEEHSLFAHDTRPSHAADRAKRQVVTEPNYGQAAGHLTWASEHTRANYPGEIQWVGNETHQRRYSAGRVAGVGEALMRSAHYFDFGQSTVPLHSPNLTEQGHKFRRTVMPEMRGTAAVRGPGGRGRYETPEGVHPYEQAEAAANAEHASKLKEGMRRNLHPKLFEGY